MAIGHVYVSEKGKKQLTRLRTKTGIQQWNHLCRWAFCLSLAEKSVPPFEDIITDSSIDMSWQTFGGEYHDVYLALLKSRLSTDGVQINDENLRLYFKIHLHRGISYMSTNIGNLPDLLLLDRAIRD